MAEVNKCENCGDEADAFMEVITIDLDSRWRDKPEWKVRWCLPCVHWRLEEDRERDAEQLEEDREPDAEEGARSKDS